MFDAGAIEARLTVNLQQFNRDMTAAEARVRRFEDAKHEVKISAVFDNASMGRARQLFTQLDQQLSREAMQRLRSSPQGSVLGALNALFSPHPVTGGPSAQQAAANGLLGKMISAPGGGGPSTLASGNQDPRRGTSVVGQVLGIDDAGLKAQASKAGRDAADAASTAAADEARRRGGGWFGGLLGGIGGAVSGLLSRGGGGGGGGGSALDRGLLGGIGPGILGLSTKAATTIGLGGSALAAVPALAAGALGLGVIGGGAAAVLTSNKQAQDQAKISLDAVKKQIDQAATPLVAPLIAAFRSLAGFVTAIGPLLKATFGAAAPLIAPFVQGIESLVKNFLPGLNSMLRAAMPVFQVLGGFLSTFGRALGTMLSQFGTVLGPSSQVLKALLDVVTGLLPIIGKLAQIFASALGPVFVQFAGVIRGLLPALTIVGKVLAGLAGAVIGDLVGAFGSVAQLLKDITPSLTTFAGALGQVFNVLENSGAFAVAGNALESLAGPLATLINDILRALIPAMPALVGAFTDLANGGVVVVTRALAPLITGLSWLVQKMPAIVPVALGIALAFKAWAVGTAAVALATKGLVAIQTAWAAITNFDTLALKAMYAWDLIVAVATKAWAVAQAALNFILDANPIGLIVLAVAALGVAVFELVKHWSTVWGEVKRIAEDAWNFIYNGWGKFLLPLLGPAGLLVLGIIEVWQNWKKILGFLVQFVIGDFVQPVTNALLDLVGFMLHGLADAFGWIPGLGPKLSAAAKAFDQFRDQVNQALAGIVKSVDVNLSTSGSGSIKITGSGITARTINTTTGQVNTIGGHTAAAGMLVASGAGPTVDDQPALLARGEVVVPARMVAAGMVNNLRGLIPGFSAGGLIGGKMLTAGNAIANSEALFGQAAAVAFAQAALSAVQSAAASAGSGGGFSVPGGPPASGPLQAYAQALLAAYGWASQWAQFADIVMRESGWNVYATNPSSGAYGIPQALPPGKMASAGADWRTNGYTQLRWMMAYIKSRWGTPASADANEIANHWYANGGIIGEPVLGYGLSSGQRYVFGESGAEAVIPMSALAGVLAGGGGVGTQVIVGNISLPEGTTVAHMLQELNWRLMVARLQNPLL